MAKTLLYRLFGIGKLPTALVTEMASEGILFSDEGIRGTVTYNNFRGGGRISNWKRQWFAAAIVVTQERLVGYRLRERIIDVPLNDLRLARIDFTVEQGETLAVCFDANLFQTDWKGRIEYRFRTPLATEIADYLSKQVNC